MHTSLQVAVVCFLLAIFGTALACSSVPISPREIASAPAVSIGMVVGERIRESAPGEEYYRSRTAIVQVTQRLKGSMPSQVLVGISCGSGYAPAGTRVVVAMMEPNIFGLSVSEHGFEQAVLTELRLAR